MLTMILIIDFTTTIFSLLPFHCKHIDERQLYPNGEVCCLHQVREEDVFKLKVSRPQ